MLTGSVAISCLPSALRFHSDANSERWLRVAAPQSLLRSRRQLLHRASASVCRARCLLFFSPHGTPQRGARTSITRSWISRPPSLSAGPFSTILDTKIPSLEALSMSSYGINGRYFPGGITKKNNSRVQIHREGEEQCVESWKQNKNKNRPDLVKFNADVGTKTAFNKSLNKICETT